MTPKEKRQLRNKISARNFRVRRKGSFLPSCFFSPDWAHLAAIRQEVQGMLFREYNLRQPFYPTVTSSEHQILRAGWWTPPCPPSHPPQLLDERFRDPQVGWDWAGVEGMWW